MGFFREESLIGMIFADSRSWRIAAGKSVIFHRAAMQDASKHIECLYWLFSGEGCLWL
jgi:hypothetical protein